MIQYKNFSTYEKKRPFQMSEILLLGWARTKKNPENKIEWAWTLDSIIFIINPQLFVNWFKWKNMQNVTGCARWNTKIQLKSVQIVAKVLISVVVYFLLCSFIRFVSYWPKKKSISVHAREKKLLTKSDIIFWMLFFRLNSSISTVMDFIETIWKL